MDFIDDEHLGVAGGKRTLRLVAQPHLLGIGVEGRVGTAEDRAVEHPQAELTDLELDDRPNPATVLVHVFSLMHGDEPVHWEGFTYSGFADDEKVAKHRDVH
ncbi:hypothetical protein KBJ94_22745 [Pseudomonas sp. ITA]|uniref:hypothetical protein n=1 Tax=Pseudomonas sp. ITA TaxID=2825841 RepID=UPI0024972BBC|nr:hypothetical protein [Pseudomonas sp. ITA]MDI2144877.1 hypothetical protein [Pseudomonas sp. ITA]